MTDDLTARCRGVMQAIPHGKNCVAGTVDRDGSYWPCKCWPERDVVVAAAMARAIMSFSDSPLEEFDGWIEQALAAARGEDR